MVYRIEEAIILQQRVVQKLHDKALLQHVQTQTNSTKTYRYTVVPGII